MLFNRYCPRRVTANFFAVFERVSRQPTLNTILSPSNIGTTTNGKTTYQGTDWEAAKMPMLMSRKSVVTGANPKPMNKLMSGINGKLTELSGSENRCNTVFKTSSSSCSAPNVEVRENDWMKKMSHYDLLSVLFRDSQTVSARLQQCLNLKSGKDDRL